MTDKTQTTEHKLIRDMALCINNIWPWADSEALEYKTAKQRREHDAEIRNALKLLHRFNKWQNQQ